MNLLKQSWIWISIAVLHPQAFQAQWPDYHVRLFDERHGLRLDLQQVITDQRDFLWLASHDRIFRFDGRQEKTFYFRTYIHSLFCDRHNQVWASAGNVIYRFINDHVGFVEVPVDTSRELSFGTLFQLPGKPMWLHASHGFYAWDEVEKKFTLVDRDELNLSFPVNTGFLGLYESTLFVSARDSFIGIDVQSGARRAMPRVNAQGGFYAISDHELLVTSRGNITFWCDLRTQSAEQIGAAHGIGQQGAGFLFVEFVLPMDERHVLVSAHEGVFVLDKQKRKFDRLEFYHEGKPLDRTTYSFGACFDRERNIWMVNGNGLIRFSPFKETIGLIRSRHIVEDDAWTNSVRNLAEDEKGNMWIATSGGFGYWDLSTNEIRMMRGMASAEDVLNEVSIRGLHYENQFLFMGTSARGLWIYNTTSGHFRRPGYRNDAKLQERIENEFVKQICKLPDGRLCIVARRCYILDPLTFEISEFKLDSVIRGQPSVCHVDSKQQVWIGTDHGLIHYDGNLRLIDSWHSEKNVVSLLERNEDTWWIGSTHGLFTASTRGDSINMTPVPFISPYALVAFIFRDVNDVVWFGGNEGLLRFDPKDSTTMLFDYADNMQLTRMYAGPHLRRDGTLFIAGQNGINYFRPERIAHQHDSLQVSIVKVIVNEDDTSYYDRAGLRSLLPGQNAIEIQYVAPYYGNTDKIKYRYKLEGMHEDWQSSATGTIRFSALPPQSYVFRVQASLNGIDWFEGHEQLRFTITPHFYQRWWFVTGALCMLGSMLYVGIKKRFETLREKERISRQYEKRIAEVEMHALRAQMNPHFMFNSLNSINNFILKNDPDNASGYLTKFSRLMRLILDNSRSEWIVLENELRALELYIQLEVVRFDHIFDYSLIVDPSIDVATTFVPPMIVQPYVENAIWHGLLHRKKPGGRLIVRIWREAERLHITVSDNGIGREAAARLKSKTATKHKSHGLRITAERIDIVNRIYNVNAHVHIEDLNGHDGKDTGTIVTLTLQDKVYDSHHHR